MSDPNNSANLNACGYVLSTPDFKYFALRCIHCPETFGQWKHLIKHLKGAHTGQPIEWLQETHMPTAEKVTPQHSRDAVPRANMVERHPRVAPLTIDSIVKGGDSDSSDSSSSSSSDDSEKGGYMKTNDLTKEVLAFLKHQPKLWNIPDIDNWDPAESEWLIRNLESLGYYFSWDEVKQFLSLLYSSFKGINRRLSLGEKVSRDDMKYWEMAKFLGTPNIEAVAAVERNKEEDQGPIEFDMEELAISSEEDDNMTEAGASNKIETRKRFSVNFSTINPYTCDFIQHLYVHPSLWNPQHAGYNDQIEHEAALKVINDYFFEKYQTHFTSKTLKNAVTRVLLFYRRTRNARIEMTEERKSYFERCAFLADAIANDSAPAGYKLQFNDLNDFALDFIKYFQQFPVLWDYNHVDYSSTLARNAAFEQLSGCFQQDYNITLSKGELETGIQRLKRYYYNLENNQKAAKLLTKTDLIYLEHCKFMPPLKPKINCHICHRSVRSEATLQVHLLKEHQLGELPHKCGYCDQRFAHRIQQKEHEVRAHTQKYPERCVYCYKGFANARDLKQHEKVHTGLRDNICDQCGKNFRLKQQLAEHVMVVHEGIRRFKCELCSKDYKRKRQLDDHMKAHMNIRDKICNICGKTFTNFHGLYRHKQLHSGVKNYECKQCGKRYHQYSGLSGHMKRQHHIEERKMEVVEEKQEEA